MAKESSFQHANEEINILISEVKARTGWSDDKMAEIIGVGKQTLRNKRTEKKLYTLSFVSIMNLARMVGYTIKIEKERRVLMRKYEVIPLPELRRQYRKEISRRNSIIIAFYLIVFCLACTAFYLYT